MLISPAQSRSTVIPCSSERGFGLVSLSGASLLSLQLLPSGAPYAVRHRGTLINQVLPGPAGEGLFRLYLREHDDGTEPGARWRSTRLVGAGIPFTRDANQATWRVGPEAAPGVASSTLRGTTTLQVHPTALAWRWVVRIENTGPVARRFDVVLGQDLGLGDESAVRNNEAYASQYIDFLPVADAELGWALLARQNQSMEGGRHPWLALACTPRADSFCTDGTQFFGAEHRLTGTPAALRLDRLPGRRVQYECALAGLQTPKLELAAGGSIVVTFVARYVDDHPAASSAGDMALIRDVLGAFPIPVMSGDSAAAAPASWFTRAPWCHGDAPGEADLATWFPGPHREIERDPTDGVHSFFCGENTHVVTRAKDARVSRPHGHVLRSGACTWIDDTQYGVTTYAAGIFGAQAYFRNPSLVRLLPVVRDPLGVIRAAGQRVFVRRSGGWAQLGMPSAFALTPGTVRWIYRFGGETIEIRVWCASDLPAAFLELHVSGGGPHEFLVTHELTLGANEFAQDASVRLWADDAWAACLLDPNSFTGRHLPRTCFALAAPAAADVTVGGDELLYEDGVRRNGPYVAFRFAATERGGVIQLGTDQGPDVLPDLVALARAKFAAALAEGVAPGEPTPLRLHLSGTNDAGLGRINEVIPWFNHNAAIHFAAPHGLEQYGGGAWGVRDVCQGSLEWLLTGRQFETARRMLTTVFAQQYFGAGAEHSGLTGTWPQWFMFSPFQGIQQAHSHGDVCFWPVKAVCDYVEASGDLNFLHTFVGYTSPATFAPAGPLETLWMHCDRVITHAESRFVPGTALVNYGDGDWDDTLQPADPAMRTRLVSAWTVALAYHTLRQLAEVCRRAKEAARAARLQSMLLAMRTDFAAQLMPDGVVAGFALTLTDGSIHPLLHPRDQTTGIHLRLLPMTRSILAELFTPADAQRHLALIASELRYADGVRLMDRPAAYHGGVERLFRRAESAANVGREIGLQYVHAHLRYAEALAKVGDAEGLWTALQVVNPVGLAATVPNAATRQSNVYFSSSDADFADRYEASARWPELRSGAVSVRGGWRLYSSGPGLFLHKVRTCLLGIRESFGDIVFDPVLPRSLDGLRATLDLAGAAVKITYRVKETFGPTAVIVNGQRVNATRVSQPYRTGGLKMTASQLQSMLSAPDNEIEVQV